MLLVGMHDAVVHKDGSSFERTALLNHQFHTMPRTSVPNAQKCLPNAARIVTATFSPLVVSPLGPCLITRGLCYAGELGCGCQTYFPRSLLNSSLVNIHWRCPTFNVLSHCLSSKTAYS